MYGLRLGVDKLVAFVLNRTERRKLTGVTGEKFVCFKADSINPNLKGVCRDMWVCRGNSK